MVHRTVEKVLSYYSCVICIHLKHFTIFHLRANKKECCETYSQRFDREQVGLNNIFLAKKHRTTLFKTCKPIIHNAVFVPMVVHNNPSIVGCIEAHTLYNPNSSTYSSAVTV